MVKIKTDVLLVITDYVSTYILILFGSKIDNFAQGGDKQLNNLLQLLCFSQNVIYRSIQIFGNIGNTSGATENQVT